jgi:prepilin-type N-terminal cleavage/methylation domain-containing protein
MEEHVTNQKESRVRKFGNQGFTLIEILIVVMVLGILAMVIIPQITVSTQDARQSTLETNTMALRNAIEMYYVQHNNVYPGGTGLSVVATAQTDFLNQLTQYSNEAGAVVTTKDLANHPYGPYLKNGVLPTNPLNTFATVKCDVSLVLTATPSADDLKAYGWYFYHLTGRLVPGTAP